MLNKLIQSKWTAIGWSLIIFLLMIMPPNRIPNQGLLGIKHLDKLVHMCLFGGFMWLWYMTLYKTKKTTEIRAFLVRLFMLSAVYGIAMEFIQYFFTHREFDIWDIVADIIGAALVWAWLGQTGEKISPYGNRGRNQN